MITERLPRLATRMALTLAGSLAVSCLTTSSSSPEDSSMIQPAFPISASGDPTVPHQCAQPTDEVMQTVRNMISTPGNRLFQSRPDYSSAPGYNLRQEQQDARNQAAAKAGVSIVDLTPTISNIENNLEEPGAITYNEAEALTDKALLPFGFDVSLEKTTRPPKGSYEVTPDKTMIKDGQATEGLVTVLESFDDMPRELIALSGLEHIVIFKGLPGNTAAGYVTPGDGFKSIHLNISSGISEPIIKHELGHLVNGKLLSSKDCENVRDTDPVFAKLNGVADMYTGRIEDYRYLTYDSSYRDLKEAYDSRKRLALKYGDRIAYCSMDKDEWELGEIIRAYSIYHPNPGEDAANIIGQVMTPDNYVNIFDPKLPIIMSEAQLLLARIYVQNPRVAQYLVAISRRPTSNDPVVDC